MPQVSFANHSYFDEVLRRRFIVLYMSMCGCLPVCPVRFGGVETIGEQGENSEGAETVVADMATLQYRLHQLNQPLLSGTPPPLPPRIPALHCL